MSVVRSCVKTASRPPYFSVNGPRKGGAATSLEVVSLESVVLIVVVVALGCYLLATLIFPERF